MATDLLRSATLCAAMSCCAAAERPDIILITADDLGRQIGCYGDATVPTPNLDKLAQQGARFDRHFVAQPSCSPSRSALLTGLHPHQNGQIGLQNRGFHMTRAWPALPSLLQQAGYYTVLRGKLHVGGIDNGQYHDVDRATEASRLRSAVVPAMTTAARAAGRKALFFHWDCFDPHEPYTTAIEGLPATPITAATPFPWSDPSAKQQVDLPDYYNCIARLDALVGAVLAAHAKSGRGEALVVFWSDNGPPFPRGKTNVTEAGLNTPLIIRGPGVTAGQVRSELVSTVDLLPTLLTVAGAPMPMAKDDAGAVVYTGRPLQPLLSGAGDPAWRTTVFAGHTFHTHMDYRPARSARDGRWKLVRRLGATSAEDRSELYDLDADPHERQDLAAAHPAERERLEAELAAWRAATRDPLLDDGVRARLAGILSAPATPVPPWFAGTKPSKTKAKDH